MSGDTRAVNKHVMQDPRDKLRPGYPWMGFNMSDKMWSAGAMIVLIIVINVVFSR